MPDSRNHRGAHPRDEICFAEERLPLLRQATAQLSWLLTRGFPVEGSAELVGNRHALLARQRDALQRCAASEQACASRAARRFEPAQLFGRELWVDGYNVLLTVEAALGGGVILGACDGVYRDLSAMSRHYRRVAETRAAVEHIGDFLAALAPVRVRWLFDAPISNSGRLARLLRELAADRDWPWEVELADNPDRLLRTTPAVVATADSAVLDRCGPWLNLARLVVDAAARDAWLIDLSGGVP